MEIGIKVGDIMTRNFVSVKPETNLRECAKKMIKKRVGSLILEENGKLAGLITEKDIIWAMTKKKMKDLNEITARQIAPRKVATIKPSADLYQAINRMKKLKFRRLPVTVNGNIIGMLTLKDILRIEPSLFSDVGQIEKIKEESEKLKRITTGKIIREGICEECGSFDVLYVVDNRILCGGCRDAM